MTPPFPDLQTVFLVCCIANLMPSLGLLIVYATNRSYPGFRYWAIASAGATTSMALLAFRNWLPEQPDTIGVNLTFFAFPLFLSRGFREFAGLPPRRWIAPSVLGFVAAVAIVFTYFRPEPNIRVFLLSVLLVGLFLDCILLVAKERHFGHPIVKASLITVFAALIIWNLLRVPLALAANSPAFASLTPVVIISVTMILLTASNIWITLGVVLLNFSHAMQSLRSSEERFRQAMQHSPIGMALVAIDGSWLEVNPALCQIVGRTREELLGTKFQSFSFADDIPTDLELIASLVEGRRSSYRREKRYLHGDGRTMWVQVDVSIIFNADGSPRHLVSQVVDVTERRRTEQALHDYQQKLVLAMDAARLGHWEYDVATNRFIFDENFLKLLGLHSADPMTMTPDDYASRHLPAEAATELAEELARIRTGTEDRPNRQIRHAFFRADGSTGWMSVRCAVERDAAGRATRAYGLTQDVSEQVLAERQHRALEEQLRHAQKMEALGALAGGVAHDFNNILTGIMGHMQLAEMDLPAGHAVQLNLHEASRAARRARDLVARILTFSRRYPTTRRPAPLGPIVTEAVQLLRASLPATIEIRTVIAPDCPPVSCDPIQIHQVVMNLGTNSAHAMRDRSGILTVALESGEPAREFIERHPQVKPNHRVCLTIRDTGVGMEKAVVERIFEPFFTTKAPGEGTGLGLAVVHGIMQDHQGAIVVDTAPGAGTTLRLYFPAETPQVRANGTNGSRSPFDRLPRNGAGRRILVVDDDAAVLSVGEGVLRRCGYAPEGCTSPVDALKKFAAEPARYDAVISDLTMPGMSGVELASRVQEIRPGTPFLLASGYLHAEAHAGAKESGVAHFIRKPFDLEELVARLGEALRREPAV
ncbi:MAG TPA: PAS domain S-box protein [Candidatus Didemnitutus sp.]|nr:PAS domain S-box protein [Candidatus Didemnitutus sp.]